MNTLEQQIAIDKAMESLMPIIKASADAGVPATIWKDATEAYRCLEKAYIALAKERDADMLRRYRQGVSK